MIIYFSNIYIYIIRYNHKNNCVLQIMCLTFSLIQNIASHTNTKRDTSSEIDPYAAYYEYYANQQAAIEELPDAIPSNEIYDRNEGYATMMQDVFGSEAGVR